MAPCFWLSLKWVPDVSPQESDGDDMNIYVYMCMRMPMGTLAGSAPGQEALSFTLPVLLRGMVVTREVNLCKVLSLSLPISP